MACAHELVGVVEPDDRVLRRRVRVAVPGRLIEEDLACSGGALVVGGTGLYMRAALAPLAVAPVADPELRRTAGGPRREPKARRAPCANSPVSTPPRLRPSTLATSAG